MQRFITDERTGIRYELVGDYYYPCLTIENEEPPTLIKYGRTREKYLREHKKRGGDCTGGVTKGAFGVLFYLRHNTGNKIIHSNHNNTKKHRSLERCFLHILRAYLTRTARAAV